MQKYTLIELKNIDNSFKQSTMLKLFFFGIVIYALGYTTSITVNPIYIICDVMRLIGVLLISFSAVNLMSFRFENKYLKVIYTFYIIWLFTVVLRGFKLNYEFIKNSLFDPSGFFLYLTPLVLLLPKPPKFYQLVFKSSMLLGILCILHIAIDLPAILDRSDTASFGRFEVFVKLLAFPCGFLFMTFNYHSKRDKLIAAIVMSIFFLIAVFRARRGLIFISGSMLIFSFLLFIYLNKRKIILVIFSVLATGLMLTYLVSTSNVMNSDLLTKVNERASEDTRSGVEEFYYADMQLKDWIIGRGMSGMVAAPVSIEPDSKTPGYRTGIETDYLNIILKGGGLSFGLMLLIALPAIIKGFFLSKNILSKAAAFWILLWLMSLYPSTVTMFTFSYLLVWISIGICYSKSVRNIPDEVLEAYFRQK